MFSLQGIEAGAHRGLARRAAGHRRQQVEALGRLPEQVGVIGVDHRLHCTNALMASEGGKARPDHRLAQKEAILLGQISSGAQPATTCHDHGCNPICHIPRSER
jgi:hypothetical protein